ncbi:MAG: DUF4124 domain-containing protein [Methylotenera sp.]|nr:MAG: DUF4124 domain-containing protein [Methylotenera sp.]
MKKFFLSCIIILTPMSVTYAYEKNRIFLTTSFWYKPIPTNVSLHPNSYNYVQEFLRQKKAYFNLVNINTSTYTSPIYYSTLSTPKVNVREWDCQKKGFSDPGLKTQWTGVPIPSNALPSKGTDAEMTVYHAPTDTLYEFWRMRKTYGVWEACWGGRMQGTHNNQGIFPPLYGATATRLPFIGGQITAEELSLGEIKHAIGISLVDAERHTIFSWPAMRSDGWNPYNVKNRIPEGLRFRLDPTVNVDALPMSRAGKIIAKAAQRYGFVIWDKAGAISIRAQNVTSYTLVGKPDPYPALFNYKPSYEVLNGFPWSRLQFLPMNYRVQ